MRQRKYIALGEFFAKNVWSLYFFRITAGYNMADIPLAVEFWKIWLKNQDDLDKKVPNISIWNVFHLQIDACVE